MKKVMECRRGAPIEEGYMNTTGQGTDHDDGGYTWANGAENKPESMPNAS
jgi:hypothetical protein